MEMKSHQYLAEGESDPRDGDVNACDGGCTDEFRIRKEDSLFGHHFDGFDFGAFGYREA
jgi:hypothetical protein